MTDITRYNDACGGIEHAPEGEGDYVLYEDHIAIVEGLKAEIAQLERSYEEAVYRIGF